MRTELAVPMMARRKLVGVIDMQSTRPNAYTEHDRALLRLIAGAGGRLHRQRAALLARGAAEPHAEGADRHLAGVFVDPGRGRTAEQNRTTVRGLIDYDAFNILLVDGERKLLRHRFSIRYDQRVDLDNVPLGKGHHRRSRGTARAGARAGYQPGPPLYRVAPGHPLGGGHPADDARPGRG